MSATPVSCPRSLRSLSGIAITAVRSFALALVLASGVAPHAHAIPGDLDPTFAGLSLVSVGENVMCHAVAPDGKIVLAGNSSAGILLSRRLANGQPDNTFGGDGDVLVTSASYTPVVRSVAVQPDGKIVVAGYNNATFADFLVARITVSGLADPTFGGDGFVRTEISGESDYAEKVLIQPDGKIVLVGHASVNFDSDFAVARYLTDGTLDVSFSGDGKFRFGFGSNDRCYDAVLQADGKLVMVGGTDGNIAASQNFAIARLHPSGALDGSFDGDGLLSTGFGGTETAYAVAIQPVDLRIVVAGRGKAARYYSSDGSLDGSFDGDGKLSLPIDAYDAAITPGGKIALIGIGGTVARVLRLNSNGSKDTEYEGDGDAAIESDVVEGPSLSLLADGRVLTVVPKGSDCWLRQYWADGFPDAGGKQAAAFDDATFPTGSLEIAHDMAIQLDGRIVVAGEVTSAGYTESDFALMRFMPDGRLDTSFGVRGRAALSLGNIDIARAVAIQPDGKIVVAGTTGVGNATNFMIARFNSNGTLDNTFGFGGYNAVDFLGGPDYGWAIALVPDGRIVVAGTVWNTARSVFGVACFNSNGTLATSFDLDGRKFYEFSIGPSHWASAVVVQGSSRIIVGGSVGADFALVAFTLTGAVDVSFAGSGRLIRNLGGDDYLEALVLGSDGMIYAGGSRVISGNADWALARWTSNGNLQFCSFGCSGLWTDERAFVDFGSTSGWLDALHVRSDGQILAAGRAGSNMRWQQFNTSSSTPVVGGVTTFPGNGTAGYAVGFHGANGVVVAGAHFFQNDRNVALARFETTPNASVSVDDEPVAIAPALRLASPTPNPLINRSTFAFELPRAQSVRLAIHDASGRRVRTLMDGALAAGSHQRQWDGVDDHGRSVAAGMYFVRLESGDEQARASLVVLR